MDTKICSKCKRELPALPEYFWRDISHKDGLHSWCKSCCTSNREIFVQRDRKICCRCKNELPSTEEYFFRNYTKADGFRDECKACAKKYYQDNKEKIREQRKSWRRANSNSLSNEKKRKYKSPEEKLKTREKQIGRAYSSSIEEIQDKMNKQLGCCAICGDSLVYPDSKRSYMIDHNHSTGKTRGLLCVRCNSALGSFKENINSLEAAISYLEEYNNA